MQCSSCGAQLPAGAAYCPICGRETSSNLSDPHDSRPSLPSSDPNQYPQDTPYSTPPPPLPSFSSPNTSEALTIPSQSRRSRGMRTPTSPGTRRTLLLVLVVLVLLVGVGSTIFILYQKAQRDSMNPYSTNPGTLALNDSLRKANHYLQTGINCAFTEGAYRLTADKGAYTTCLGGPLFGDFAFEVQMTVLKGDCGGIVFRDDAEGHYYLFEVCPNGGYGVYLYFGQGGNDFEMLQIGHSSAIKMGLNQSNLVAAMAISQDIQLYINRQTVSLLRDQSYKIGTIGFIADGSGSIISGSASSTEVGYNNLKVWTF